MQGTGPIDVSVSVAQSNRCGLCTVASSAGWAVGGGGLPRTSPWVSSIPSCSPLSDSSTCSASGSLAMSLFSALLSCSSSLLATNSLLSRCSIVVVVGLESVAVAVGARDGVEAGTGVGAAVVGLGVSGVLTWRASATRSSCSGVVVVLGAAVLVGAGVTVVVVVVLVSREVVVAAPGCLVVAGIIFGISCNKFGEARSHFTRKCKTRVDQEVTAAGMFCSRFSYQSSASESDLQ